MHGKAHHDAECILVLQGGGALGSYQAGVYEVLTQSCLAPEWIAGISIGAINAALIAGNAPERRLERLRAFWERVTSAAPQPSPGTEGFDRQALNESSATHALVFGVPGFFVPRFPPAPLQPRGTLAAISFYNTEPLRETLTRLIDFDRINSGDIRLSVGAVNVRTGNFVYFDSAHQRLDVRHIMASGALPPAFAPIEIDGEFYWDGGLVSNTPLQYVLDQSGTRPRMIFQVDLFSARGALPASIADVNEREKDIRFSSRTRLNTDNEMARRQLAMAARRLRAKLPPELRDDPDMLALAELNCAAPLDIVHLIYRSKHYERYAKDYVFSRLAMQEHWESGRVDMLTTLARADHALVSTSEEAGDIVIQETRIGRRRAGTRRMTPK